MQRLIRTILCFSAICSIGVTISVPTVGATPNDPDYAQQWNLHSLYGMGIPQAWNNGVGNKKVVVAVLDTGVDYNHPDLNANMWRNPGETGEDKHGRDKATNDIDDDHNGYVDDVYGANVVTRNGDPMDDNGHGTHVAGIIGAVGNNGIGVSGINQQASIMAVKFMYMGRGGDADIVRGIDYAVKNGAKVINASVGCQSCNKPVIAAAIKRASDKGVLFVSAAGNNSENNDLVPFYPSAYKLPNTLTVAAVDDHGQLADLSNYGSGSVDVAAPGVHVLSTLLRNRYGFFSGTSMAAPEVSGVATLLLSQNPALTLAQLKDKIKSLVNPVDSLKDKVATGGIVDFSPGVGTPVAAIPATPANLQKYPQGGVMINDGAASAPEQRVLMHFYLPNYQVSKVEYQRTDQHRDTWQELPLTNGGAPGSTESAYFVFTYRWGGMHVDVRFTDENGNVSQPVSVSTWIDIDPPGTFKTHTAKRIGHGRYLFFWNPAQEAASYELVIKNKTNGKVTRVPTKKTQLKLKLSKGKYYWYVKASDKWNNVIRGDGSGANQGRGVTVK